MNAKERILKTVNHEEPDRVPSFEVSIDNLKVYDHFRLKYGYQGNGDLLKKTFDLMKGDAQLLKKFVDKSSKTKIINIVKKMRFANFIRKGCYYSLLIQISLVYPLVMANIVI